MIRQLVFATFLALPHAMAQDTEADRAREQKVENNLDDLTLEDLFDSKVTVATKKESTAHNTPGIVTVITDEDISNMGARDLIDVLSQVQGINFNLDVENTVDIAVRGLWAHEGKFLLLIDGQEMNEILYSTVQLGNHY